VIGLILLLAAPALELEASGGVAFPSPPHPAQGPKAAALQIRAGLDFLDHLQHGGQVMRVRDSVASGTGSTLSQALIGTWKLVSSEFNLSSGDVIHPYGNDAVGLLIYAEDGQMSAQIMRRGRPSFASGDVLRHSRGNEGRPWTAWSAISVRSRCRRGCRNRRASRGRQRVPELGERDAGAVSRARRNAPDAPDRATAGRARNYRHRRPCLGKNGSEAMRRAK